MNLKTMNAASTIPYAPSRQYLSKVGNNEPRPAYFYDDDDSLKIDIDHPEWIDLLDHRRQNAEVGIRNGQHRTPKKLTPQEEATILLESVSEAIIEIVPKGNNLIPKIQKAIFEKYQLKSGGQ